ncbi:MAG: hypothetical protein WB239_10835 [Acidimicrobiia bacterium]
MRARLVGILVLLGAVTVAGCGSTTQPLVLVASSAGSIQVGEARVLLGLVDPDSQSFLASPSLSATATFVGPDHQSISDIPLDFAWAVPEVRGLYEARTDFPSPGNWSVTVSAEGYPTTDPAVVVVSQETAMPQVGDSAPPAVTRTLDDGPLSEISSDPDPDPDFYRLSLDQALADGKPTVVVFATPAFCTSATCGPMLDTVKGVAADHPGADYVHVEIYQNLDATSFDDLIPVKAVETWALPSEPWVFVTDSQGIITARWEGTVDAGQLAAALTQVGA